MTSPINLRDLDAAQTVTALASYGISPPVARKVFARVHSEGATDLLGVAGLGGDARRALEADVTWPDLTIVERRRASDGFVKYLFRLADGHEIEAVRIPLPDPADARALKERRKRGEAAGLEALPTAKYTLCVSSQVGCALACDFCATGRLGGIRNLATWEILAQHRLIAAESDKPIRGVVFMGMGEPFLNYDNVIRAGRVFMDPAGPAISGDAISISTAGVVPMIRRFTHEGHPFRLIVSLSASNSTLRIPLMPIEKRWPLPELFDAIRAYNQAAKGRVTLAYVAIGGVNLEPSHAHELAALCEGLRVKVNLIDVVDATHRYQPPGEEELRAFRGVLSQYKIPTVRRYSGGRDIGASCGTLAATRQGGALVQLRRPEAP